MFGAAAPNVVLSEFVPTCGCWALILDLSQPTFSTDWNGWGRVFVGLERAPRCAGTWAVAITGIRLILAGQSSDRVNALLVLSARQCSANGISDGCQITPRTEFAKGLHTSGCERAGQWHPKKLPGTR